MKPIFSISLMCMDFLHIKKQLDVLNRYGDIYHADIMDGHFCKNITLSPGFIKSIRPAMALPVEAHLMVTDPNEFLEMLAEAGVDSISVHAETINVDAFRTIRRIKKLGCKVGVVLNPATPLSWAEYYLGEIDYLTIMTVDVGYAGQPFIKEVLDKIRLAEEWKITRGYSYLIQVDGACNRQTYNPLYTAGARSFVMGSTGLFGLDSDVENACIMMKREFDDAVMPANILDKRKIFKDEADKGMI